jgi:hypothetical protein
MSLLRALSTTAAALAFLGVAARASEINSGFAAGVAHTGLCPVLSAQLKLAQFDYSCIASAGAHENVERVLADPRQLGYAPLDALFEVSRQLEAGGAFTILRPDDQRECLFAVTRNAEVSGYRELAANAGRLRFILPPASSAAAASFAFLSSIDADGLARAKSVAYADTREAALREALSADDTVSLLVAFPDPANFALVRKLGGHVVSVIDRSILRQEVGGRKVYFAQEVEIEAANWVSPAKMLITACTPLVVFTGTPDRVAEAANRKDHEDLIRTVGALDRGVLLPKASVVEALVKRSKELSADSTEKMLAVGERARAKAKPFTEKALEAAKEATDQAKQAAERAAVAAKPYMEKGKDAARKAYDDALRLAKELVEKPRSDGAPKKE